MAGTLTVDTLKASTGVFATQNGMSGLCNAWVSFTGSTAAIRGSFNVSSVTRTSTGIYTNNFTTALPDANYSMVAGVGSGAGNTAYTSLYNTVPSTTSASFLTFNGAGASTDWGYTNAAVFR